MANSQMLRVVGTEEGIGYLKGIMGTSSFDAPGVAYPTDEWSWDAFRDAAKQLTDPATETYGYAYSVSGSEETTWQFWPHLWQHGGKILTDDQKTSAFASPEGEQALEFLRAMAQDDKSVYLDQTDTKFGQLFAANRIGTEEGQRFYGHTFIADEWGDLSAEFHATETGVLTATIDLARAAKHRAGMGFFRDRRPQLYGRISQDI